ncbi:MAG: relaxase domain-containing protein [Verrucomicrobia bacterium]|nr:relaxase domain-containing protein [Verrucomicrobiota bacterium]
MKGAVAYFRENMGIGDYLSEDGRAELTWHGVGAERLGLRGRCLPAEFENLCRRQHPVTGKKLTVRDRGAEGRVCYFGQISPPKDVSLACLVGGDQRIRGWWDEAVRETLKEIEAVTATRVRKNGADEDRVTGNMVAAVVTHETSRALDPQLHTHVSILNVTFDAVENRWKSVQPSGYYRHQAFFREVCYNRLAAKLRGAGYEIEPARKIGFNIKGVPAELRAQFSQRREHIMREAQVVGATSQDAVQTIAGRNRDPKVSVTAAELRIRWRAQAGDELATLQTVIATANQQKTECPSNSSAALRSGGAHLFERQSVVDERELLREALIARRGETSPDELRTELATQLKSGELLQVGPDVGSRETLAAEREFVDWAKANRWTAAPLGKLKAESGLEPDQADAVSSALGSRSRVVILQGDAGTGKTTSLKALVASVEQAGGFVFGCAPSSGAADVLRRELTPQADTLQQLLVNTSLQEKTRGRLLVVDEAGLISVLQMRDLCRLAASHDCRLLLVGDTKQHSSVEAGDALRCLQAYSGIPAVRLTRIRRQKDPAYREAVSLLARGDASGAFDRFVRLGAVREIKNAQTLFRTAAEDYVRTIDAGKTCIAISPVWSEIHAFTAEVRDQLRTAGRLGESERKVAVVHSLQWTREQMRRASHYQAGDVLTFNRSAGGFTKDERAVVVRGEAHVLVVRTTDGRQRNLDPKQTGGFDVGLGKELLVATCDRLLIRSNCKPAKLKNGEIVTVSGFAADGRIALEDGRHLPVNFSNYSYGYATTSHGSQGKTVARGLLLLADEGLRAANIKQAYVSNSRFQEGQTIYTTDKRAARDAMQRPADRRLASEVFARPPTASASFRQMLLHRINQIRVANPALAALRGCWDTLSSVNNWIRTQRPTGNQ